MKTESPPDLMFEVDSQDLSSALRSMRKLGGKTPGPGIWRFENGELTVEWKGGAHAMDATGGGSAAFRVPEMHMDALAQTISESGTVRVEVLPATGHVKLDGLKVSLEAVEGGATDLLPVDAGPLEVVMLAYQRTPQEIANAGLAEAVQEAKERAEHAVRDAAEALRWLRIDEARLAEWVDAHLRAVSKGKSSFEIASGAPAKGQLDLFG